MHITSQSPHFFNLGELLLIIQNSIQAGFLKEGSPDPHYILSSCDEWAYISFTSVYNKLDIQ